MRVHISTATDCDKVLNEITETEFCSQTLRRFFIVNIFIFTYERKNIITNLKFGNVLINIFTIVQTLFWLYMHVFM